MADSRSANAPVVPSPIRPGRPLSEALLNEKWDHCLSTLLIRSTLGASFGVIFSVLLFKRRAFPVWVGLGFGAGRAWEECDSVGHVQYLAQAQQHCWSAPMRGLLTYVSQSFKRATAPSRDGLRTLRSP